MNLKQTRLVTDDVQKLTSFYERLTGATAEVISSGYVEFQHSPCAGLAIRSLQELKDAIHRFLEDTNANPKPFTWTKDPNKIIAAVKRGHQVLDSIH
jgi:hypothetical protein